MFHVLFMLLGLAVGYLANFNCITQVQLELLEVVSLVSLMQGVY